MIFLDTNIFLRYLVAPVTTNDYTWHEQATALFEAIARGTEEATTSPPIWSDHPSLGFVDALTAATVAQSGVVLASVDADFDDLPGISRWRG